MTDNQKTQAPGILIAIEGIDGSGTTTQTKRIADLIAKIGDRARSIYGYSGVHATREPSDGPIGKLIRQMLTGEHSIAGEVLDPRTLALLFAADRTDHVQREVGPAVAAGKIVVSDRWYHSSLAYQSTSKERFNWIFKINSHIRTPDLTILLRIDPSIAAKRRVAAGRIKEIFDDHETQVSVSKWYDRTVDDLRFHGHNIKIIDASRPAGLVTVDIAACIDSLLYERIEDVAPPRWQLTDLAHLAAREQS